MDDLKKIEQAMNRLTLNDLNSLCSESMAVLERNHGPTKDILKAAAMEVDKFAQSKLTGHAPNEGLPLLIIYVGLVRLYLLEMFSGGDTEETVKFLNQKAMEGIVSGLEGQHRVDGFRKKDN